MTRWCVMTWTFSLLTKVNVLFSINVLFLSTWHLFKRGLEGSSSLTISIPGHSHTRVKNIKVSRRNYIMMYISNDKIKDISIGTTQDLSIFFLIMLNWFSSQVSLIEIYNETIQDLLTTDAKPLELRTAGNKVSIPNLKEVVIRNLDDIKKTMAQGDKNRTVASTKMNSTRSVSVKKKDCF